MTSIAPRGRCAGLALALALTLTSACQKATTPDESPRSPGLGDAGEVPAYYPANLPAPAGDPMPFGERVKVAAFAGRWEEYTLAERTELTRFGLLALRVDPDAVAEIHRLNPDARLFYRVMPQTVSETGWERSWSWMDWVRTYAVENDWILRHDDGSEASMRGAGYWHWLDFSEACPEGIYVNSLFPSLDSRGLTVAEWLAERFIPWFVANRFEGYEGLWWEVIAERPSPAWFHFDVPDPAGGGRLDWDRNGVADIEEGGWSRFDDFVGSWENVADGWLETVRANIGSQIPIVGGGDSFTPSLSQLDGFKNEDFLNRNRYNGGSWNWWTEFYSQPGSTPRRGYVLQRDNLRESWSLAVNQIFWYDNGNWSFSDPRLREKYVRFALGTTLLGDGWFMFYDIEQGSANGQPRNPWMPSLYDVKLGTLAYPFQRHVEEGDTLYVRYFAKGDGRLTRVLVVNPNPRHHLSVWPEDAKIFEVPRDQEPAP